MWKPIETGPRSPVEEGWSRGPLVWLLIPYTNPAADVGYWCLRSQCWRHVGDDGPDDIQPTHWQELPEPELPSK